MKAGSVWAITDQAVASAGNFVTLLLLARGLAPTEFGTFALINSICVVVFGFHANLVVSPLVVLAAPASGAKSRTYTTAALLVTFALLPASVLAVFLSSVPLHREETGLLAAGYVLCWQLQETARRALTSKLRYRDAIWGDAISYLGQALLIFLLIMRSRLALNEAFALMAATSLAAAALQCCQAGLARASWDQLHPIGIAIWNLGRWLALGNLAGLAVIPLFLWLLNWFHGREAAASFQAVLNVLGFANPIILSVPAIVVPEVASFIFTRREQRSQSLEGLGMRYVVWIGLILAPFLLFLTIWPRLSLLLFYGKASPYLNQTTALRAAVFALILAIPLTVFLAVLAGAGKTKGNAIALGTGAAAALLFAPPLIFAAGSAGGMLSLIANRMACVLMTIRFLRSPSALRSENGEQPSAVAESVPL